MIESKHDWNSSSRSLDDWWGSVVFTPGLSVFQRCRTARRRSFAVAAASVCRSRSSAMRTRTVTTPAMRSRVPFPPAAPPPSSAITPCVCRSSGPATGTPTAPTGPTSGSRTARPGRVRSRSRSAGVKSSCVAAESVFTPAGGATEASTASTAQTRTTAVSSVCLVHGGQRVKTLMVKKNLSQHNCEKIIYINCDSFLTDIFRHLKG